MEELSLLTLRFGKNVLDATNAYELNIIDPDNLAGMPEYVKDAGRKTAEDRGQDGWTYTLDRPSYGPFMQYCANPELRRQMYMAYNTRAVESNSEIVRRIAELRLRVANLLGYETWADYVLEENMAKNTDTVQSFLEELMVPSLPFARKKSLCYMIMRSLTGLRELLPSSDFLRTGLCHGTSVSGPRNISQKSMNLTMSSLSLISDWRTALMPCSVWPAGSMEFHLRNGPIYLYIIRM